jgi:hypothetical protein
VRATVPPATQGSNRVPNWWPCTFTVVGVLPEMILLARSDVDLEILRVSDSRGRILACGSIYDGSGCYATSHPAFSVVEEPEVWEEPMPRFPKLRDRRDRNSFLYDEAHPRYCLDWERDPEGEEEEAEAEEEVEAEEEAEAEEDEEADADAEEEEEEEAEEVGEEHSGVDQEEED